MKYAASFLIAFFIITSSVIGQAPEKWTSGEIYQNLKKLNFLGAVLYVAAHPDDENTRLISYFSNTVNANTAYLSLTRGDGGQNLIGPEISQKLGIIRTQELLAARSIDGGSQFFSRANDFGYSKHPDETFNIWNKDEVLSDIVWVIRKFRPDIIINRFDHRTPGQTHGHHTGSAILAHEAFDLTSNPDVFPEQLEHLEPWKPERLFFNTSWWFYGSQENFDKADKSNLIEMDMGTYYPILGKSNTEIAAEARSMHKCQGFGSSGTRGSAKEYIELLKGQPLSENYDPFAGINTTWSRVKGGEKIGTAIEKIINEFKFDDPAMSVPALLNVQTMIADIDDDHWKNIKLKELNEIIKQCLGLYALINVNDDTAAPGTAVSATAEIVNRSTHNVELTSFEILPGNQKIITDTFLSFNQSFFKSFELDIPENAEYTTPYWLEETAKLGMYTVSDQLLRGLPENDPSYHSTFHFEINKTPYTYHAPIVYKTTDPVKGEIFKPFVVVPEFSVRLLEETYIFPNEQSKNVNVVVKAGKDNIKGKLKISHPQGWSVSPQYHEVSIEKKGAEQFFRFILTPSQEQEEVIITPVITNDKGVTFSKKVEFIEYDHIPSQIVITDAGAKAVKLDIQTRGKKVAYIQGAGDNIPASLEQIGYDVDIISIDEASTQKLKNYDALILGVRAYNTIDRIGFYFDNFMKYVHGGGTMIVQYNTSRGINLDQLGPYSLTLSRERVAVEEAEVRILLPDHEVMNFPNKITSKDFDNWVQERGLYFPDKWDSKYAAILSSNDPGETPKDGGLLVAQYGQGHFIYTGYSWFRELPAGVPGAYRIFANLISIGKHDRP